MSPHAISACVLCGSETAERWMQLVEWAEPIGNQIWGYIPICRDRAACRSRVELVVGEPWPLADGTPAPVRPNPAPVVEEEVIPWLR